MKTIRSQVLYTNDDHKIINFGKVISQLKFLYSNNYRKILMIGNLKRPKLSEIKPDINSIKLIPKFAKELLKGGDNNLLNFCIIRLAKLGFEVIDLRKIIPDNFMGKGNQTDKNASKLNLQDIKKGKLILDSISKFDIGQSIIIEQGNVLGIESLYGTDYLILSCKIGDMHKRNAILVKLVKK